MLTSNATAVSRSTQTVSKSGLEELIKGHGGVLLDKIDEQTTVDQLFLITDTPPKRTFKYLMAVIMGIPRVKGQWVVDCCERESGQQRWPPIGSSAYTVDSIQTRIVFDRPLSGQVWLINKEKETRAFCHEFTIILRALGATLASGTTTTTSVIDKRNNNVHLLSSSSSTLSNRHVGRVVLVEHLVDCILNNDFTTLVLDGR